MSLKHFDLWLTSTTSATPYTLGLQILYSCVYISHEHEYIFYFFIVQLWKLMEASRSSKVILSGDFLIGWMLLTSTFGVHIQSTQNHDCHDQQTKIQNSLNCSAWSGVFEVMLFTACACKFLDSLMQRIRLDLGKHLHTSRFWCAENHLLKSWACQTRSL